MAQPLLKVVREEHRPFFFGIGGEQFESGFSEGWHESFDKDLALFVRWCEEFFFDVFREGGNAIAPVHHVHLSVHRRVGCLANRVKWECPLVIDGSVQGSFAECGDASI